MTTDYKDPYYDKIEAALEAEYGLPKGLMGAIRLHGEKTNADQVSSLGARGVYQFIPSTRNAFLKKYGVDAYAGPEHNARAAALHLIESLKWAKNDPVLAAKHYHGGPDKRRWGKHNKEYGERIQAALIQPSPIATAGTVKAPEKNISQTTAASMLPSIPGDYQPEQMTDLTPGLYSAKAGLPNMLPDVGRMTDGEREYQNALDALRRRVKLMWERA